MLHNQLTIAAHLTSYAFIADKLYKNPYLARYTLLQYFDCFIRVTALLEYLDLYRGFQPHSKKDNFGVIHSEGGFSPLAPLSAAYATGAVASTAYMSNENMENVRREELLS